MTAGKVSAVPRRYWRYGVALVMIGSLLLAACGSTAPRQATGATGSEDLGDAPVTGGSADATDNGIDGGTDTGRAGDPTRSSEASEAASAQAGGTRAESRSEASPSGGSAAPGGGGDTRAMGLGITADTIGIGIGWIDGGSAAETLVPEREISDAASRREPEAIVRWLNERGGIAGRQIRPVWYETALHDALTPSGRQRQEEAMCAKWTEDDRVFAAAPHWPIEGVFFQCAADHDLVTMSWTGSTAAVDREWYPELEHVWYSPAGWIAERREEVFVEALDRVGFFGSDAKVGVMIWDNPPERRAAARALEPAIEALGVEVVAREVHTFPHNWDNAILRFRGAGVTHVVWGIAAAALPPSQFHTAAENQGYRPMSALGTENGIGTVEQEIPEGQRPQIVGITQSPRSIGPDQYEHAEPLNESDARCREIKQWAGSRVYQTSWVEFCEGLFFIKHALERAPALTVAGFRHAVEAPGFGYQAIDAWLSAYGPGRHDGANAVRVIRWNAECECLRWVSPVQPLE